MAILLCISTQDCFLWYRRHFRRTKDDAAPNVHEMITDANRHELPAESNTNTQEIRQMKERARTTQIR